METTAVRPNSGVATERKAARKQVLVIESPAGGVTKQRKMLGRIATVKYKVSPDTFYLDESVGTPAPSTLSALSQGLP
jgi:hypothetical protein